ncbi:MAG TPA: hypothetical protein VFZ18_12315 [Longimicrobiaceae bacterium]
MYTPRPAPAPPGIAGVGAVAARRLRGSGNAVGPVHPLGMLASHVAVSKWRGAS